MVGDVFLWAVVHELSLSDQVLDTNPVPVKMDYDQEIKFQDIVT